MTNLIFDLETNGLLHDLTCIHCLVIYNIDADQTTVYNDEGNTEPIVRGISFLEEADCIAGHNIIGYDIPAIKKLYPWFNPKGVVIDTLLLSRLYHADILAIDRRREWKPSSSTGVTAWKPTATAWAKPRVNTARTRTGLYGLKRCKTTVCRTL